MCTRSIGADDGIECAENGDAAIAPRTKRRQQTDDDEVPQGTVTRRTTGDRIRDRNGFRRRAAAFCARIALSLAENGANGDDGSDDAVVPHRWPPNLGALEVLMVSGRTAAGEDGYWVLPGGGVENMESTEEAVLRELREEAGIRGKVLFCIGEFVDDQRFHHTTLFFLTVREVFTEWGENCENGRQRRWMGMDEARKSIKHNQRDMLERSIKIIEQTLGKQLEPSLSKCLSAVPVVSLRAAEDGIGIQQQQQKQLPSPSTVKATAQSGGTDDDGTGEQPKWEREQLQQKCTERADAGDDDLCR
ncbi:hypothetical protein niasHT_038467 [Heterodera trifolii]|uniref:diphosphoinositol-polyphosphate diphosphatase n=1 Tax=Heterodera trifolii TaxID=157864 RepID=A0ABD2ISV4_9BILA